ncbi:hypothetical protein ACOME3_006561 [Neoechinorhynchus agilis]
MDIDTKKEKICSDLHIEAQEMLFVLPILALLVVLSNETHLHRRSNGEGMQTAIAGAALGPTLFKRIFGGSEGRTGAKDRVMSAMAAVAIGKLFQPRFDQPSFCNNDYVRLATTIMSDHRVGQLARMLEIFGCSFGGRKAMIKHNEVVTERKRDRMLRKIKQIFGSGDNE